MYKGLYGTLEKDLINIGIFKEYKINIINKLEVIKLNKRKTKDLDKTLTELAIFSTWIWNNMNNSVRMKHMVYYRLYDMLELDKTNQFEMYFINNFIYNRMKDLVKSNKYKIELEGYYV